ncbi:MAG TPA: hypothetical protein VLH13_03945, partial [Methanomassiliicoccales archaeon]|nr:hypothetical protein [Methanomassiliicoccales archaeon]
VPGGISIVGISFRRKCVSSLPRPGSTPEMVTGLKVASAPIGPDGAGEAQIAKLVIKPKMPLYCGEYGDDAQNGKGVNT